MKTSHIVILSIVGLVIAGAVIYASIKPHKKGCSCGGDTATTDTTTTEE